MTVLDVDQSLNLVIEDNFYKTLYSFIVNLSFDENTHIGEWYDKYYNLFYYIRTYGYNDRYKQIYKEVLKNAQKKYPHNTILHFMPPNLYNFVVKNHENSGYHWWLYVFY